MYLIIDGYNLLHSMSKASRAGQKPGEREKAQFIAQLARYAAQRHHKLVVVFDGGPLPIATYEQSRSAQPEWAPRPKAAAAVSKGPGGSITIVHVGYKETADDYIKRVLDDAKKDMVLISSDNALLKHAKMVGVEAIDSDTFANIVREKEVSKTRQTVIKGDDIKRLAKSNVASGSPRPVLHSLGDGGVGADDDLATIMEQESRKLPIKEEDMNIEFKTKRTPSKHEKKQSKVLKKL